MVKLEVLQKFGQRVLVEVSQPRFFIGQALLIEPAVIPAVFDEDGELGRGEHGPGIG